MLPQGVHFFCLPKRNEPKKKAPDIALSLKIHCILWRGHQLATLKHVST